MPVEQTRPPTPRDGPIPQLLLALVIATAALLVSMGFNWKRATPLAANGALSVSLLINLALELLVVRLPWGIHGGVVAMLISLALFLGISLVQAPPRLAPDIEAALDV